MALTGSSNNNEIITSDYWMCDWSMDPWTQRLGTRMSSIQHHSILSVYLSLATPFLYKGCGCWVHNPSHWFVVAAKPVPWISILEMEPEVVAVSSKNSVHCMQLSEKSESDTQSQISDGDSSDKCKVYIEQTKRELWMCWCMHSYHIMDHTINSISIFHHVVLGDTILQLIHMYACNRGVLL